MLGIIIVNYKSVDRTVHYVQRELCKITTPHRIVVVNVACDDETNIGLTNKLQACFVASINGEIDAKFDIYVLAHPENIGYAKGNNLGAAFFKKHFKMDYYLISNNDIELTDGDVVERLVEKIESLPGVGAIGPKVVGCDGRDHSPAKRVGIWKALVFPMMFYPLLYFFLGMGYFTNVVVEAREGVYYWISGAFVLVRRKVFDAANGFDSNTFLYAEEMIFSERMLAAGYYPYYLPTVSVLHEQGQVVKGYLSDISVSRNSLISKLYYYKKYCRASTLSIWVARLASEMFHIVYLPVILLARNVAIKLRSAAIRNVTPPQ